jgi:hypothetical protein
MRRGIGRHAQHGLVAVEVCGIDREAEADHRQKK